MTDKTDREIMQQALNDLEALVTYIKGGEPDLFMQVPSIEALRERLAQPEQEPVAGVVIREGLPTLLQDKHIKSTDQRLYTAPPEQGQLEWQGLFFDAVYEAWHSLGMDVLGGDWNTFASKLEEKLKEKND